MCAFTVRLNAMTGPRPRSFFLEMQKEGADQRDAVVVGWFPFADGIDGCAVQRGKRAVCCDGAGREGGQTCGWMMTMAVVAVVMDQKSRRQQALPSAFFLLCSFLCMITHTSHSVSFCPQLIVLFSHGGTRWTECLARQTACLGNCVQAQTTRSHAGSSSSSSSLSLPLIGRCSSMLPRTSSSPRTSPSISLSQPTKKKKKMSSALPQLQLGSSERELFLLFATSCHVLCYLLLQVDSHLSPYSPSPPLPPQGTFSGQPQLFALLGKYNPIACQFISIGRHLRFPERHTLLFVRIEGSTLVSAMDSCVGGITRI